MHYAEEGGGGVRGELEEVDGVVGACEAEEFEVGRREGGGGGRRAQGEGEGWGEGGHVEEGVNLAPDGVVVFYDRECIR